jgi:prepilin signal peptidase PulO-like enzyme (type II secretory pathway)
VGPWAVSAGRRGSPSVVHDLNCRICWQPLSMWLPDLENLPVLQCSLLINWTRFILAPKTLILASYIIIILSMCSFRISYITQCHINTCHNNSKSILVYNTLQVSLL